MSKYLELAKKLKALADRGVGGEKVNAEAKLKKLMQVHGFTMEDIEGEKTEYHYFKVPVGSRQLFGQIAATVLGRDHDVFGVKKKKDQCAIKTTAALRIEIETKFDFYYTAYKNELSIFYSAFISANDLYPKDGAILDGDTLSKEERERLIKVQKLAEGIDAQKYLKRLTA